jgi:hypothetical protein
MQHAQHALLAMPKHIICFLILNNSHSSMCRLSISLWVFLDIMWNSGCMDERFLHLYSVSSNINQWNCFLNQDQPELKLLYSASASGADPSERLPSQADQAHLHVAHCNQSQHFEVSLDKDPNTSNHSSSITCEVLVRIWLQFGNCSPFNTKFVIMNPLYYCLFIILFLLDDQ